MKLVSSEIGHKPTRDEFLKLSGLTRHQIVKVFGLWTEFEKAAFGEVSKKEKKEKYSPLEPILNHYADKPSNLVTANEKFPIAIIGDIHSPFVDLDTLTWIYSMLAIFKPKTVVTIGDSLDCFAQSKFPRTHNTYSPKEELDLGVKILADMWRTIQKICPVADCYSLLGNHELRVVKRVLEVAPSLEHLIDFNRHLQFENVRLIEDPKEELRIGDIKFIHGYLSNLGAHRDYLLSNVVCGHSHIGGVSYKNIGGNVLWELNAGYVGDPMSKAMSYMPTRTTRWTHGLAIVDSFGPRFLPKP